MGCYTPPDDALIIEDIVAGDFNADLDDPEEITRTEEITMALATSGLEDMITHLLPRRKYLG